MGRFTIKTSTLRSLRRRTERGLMAVANAIAGRAKELAPVNTGILRASILTASNPNGAEAYVGVVGTAPYARYLELGYRPHFVPFAAAPSLAVWARRVLGRTSGGGLFVGGRRSRLQSGTPGMTMGGYSPYLPPDKVGKPFLRPAKDAIANSGEAVRVFVSAWRRG